jgi:putative FmdB family regulatory protein
MPTYEYKCDACGHQFERFQSIMAPPVKRCPECGKAKVRRLISTGAGLIFKGSGFYITDYRDKSYKDSAKADSGGGETKSDSGGDAKPAETKAETKAESKPAESKNAEPKPVAKEAKPAKKETKPKK